MANATYAVNALTVLMAIVATNVAVIATRNAHSREDAPNPEIATVADAMNTAYAVIVVRRFVSAHHVLVPVPVVPVNAVQAAHAE